MQIVSDKFKQAMVNNPYIARITLQDQEPLQGDAIKEIVFRRGSNSGENTILLGSAFSASVEITLDRDLVACTLENQELAVALGIELADGIEWLPMGTYIADDPVDDESTLTVTARDALSARFDVDYEPITAFDFDSESGVSSVDFWTALCDRRGVKTDVEGFTPIPLKGSPEGFTERQIFGYIAALYGGFAYVDRAGVLRIGFYQVSDAKITPDEYYSDGFEQASYSVSVGWLKCYSEAADLTMFVGDFDAAQGINLESIWMTQMILNGLWERFEGFSYRPVSNLSFLGNPLIDPGDIVEVKDTSGIVFRVPVMTITHEYDGGLITTITACGQAVTSEYAGPIRKAVARSISSAKKYTDSENEKLNQLELLKRLTNSWVDDGIYLTEDFKIGINASAILTGLLDAGLLKTGIIESADGNVSIDLSNGTVTIKTNNDGLPGKIVLGRHGIDGYGWDENTQGYIRTLSLWPGSRVNGNSYATSYLQTPNLNSGLIIGSHKFIDIGDVNTPLFLGGKLVSWQNNGDGTWTMLGT